MRYYSCHHRSTNENVIYSVHYQWDKMKDKECFVYCLDMFMYCTPIQQTCCDIVKTFSRIEYWPCVIFLSKTVSWHAKLTLYLYCSRGGGETWTIEFQQPTVPTFQ